MVIDTVILSSGMPSNRIFMSSTRVDRHARLADVADDARMIAVVAAMGGEIERHRQAHLAGREVGAIELVALLGGREAGVLAHRPGTAGIHRGLGPARERREARQRAHGLEPLEVGRRVERLHDDALGRRPVERRQRLVAQLLGGELFPVGQGLLRKVSHGVNLVAGPRLRQYGVSGRNPARHAAYSCLRNHILDFRPSGP